MSHGKIRFDTMCVEEDGGDIISQVTINIMIKITLIITTSLLIGINRGKQNQFAGMKTHLFVGLGAGLSFIGPYIYYIDHPAMSGDPFRLSAQVISGIGFLGAGTIIKSGQSIRGLTTAASLWCTAIIAIIIASDAYLVSIFSTLVIIVFLSFSNKLDFTRKYSTKCIICTVVDFENNFETLNKFMKSNAVLDGNYIILEHVNSPDGRTTSIVRYDIVHRQTDLAINDIMRNLAKFKFLEKIDSVTEIEKSHLEI